MRTYFEEYKKIKDKVIVCYGELPNPLPSDKTVIQFAEFGECYEKRYRVVSNNGGLTEEECAIAVDEGNLCFGYHMRNNMICIHTD